MSVSLVKRPVICDDYRKLNSAVEFSHVFEVLPHGLVIDGPAGVYAPDLTDGDLFGMPGDRWELLDGYSAQYGYSGPEMHPSEQFAGAMARDVIDAPGVYVLITADYTNDDPETSDSEHTLPEGWAVARLLRAGVDY